MFRNSALILLVLTSAAQAHPGHDAALADGATHWLTSASHWVVVVLCALIAADLARRAVRALTTMCCLRD